MPLRSSLDCRYDGPIPYWEDPSHAGEGVRRLHRLLVFNRGMARDYALGALAALRRASMMAGVARLDAWNDAVRMEGAWRFHRRVHGMLVARKR